MIQKIGVRVVVVAVLASVFGAAAVAQTCPATTPPVGQCPSPTVDSVHGVWQEFNEDPIICWGSPFEAIHMILLKTGKVLCISNVGGNWIIDPDDPETIITLQDSPAATLFCSGHAQLADGRVFFAGGGGNYDSSSHDKTTIFDPDTLLWDDQDDDPIPTGKRWYPTCTTINKGQILVLGGVDNDDANNTNTPVIFDVAKPLGERFTELDALRTLPWYPFAFELPNADVLMGGSHFWGAAGTSYPVVTATLDTGLAEWSDDIPDPQDDDIKGSSAVMFRPGKILKAGGRPAGDGDGDCGSADVMADAQMINMSQSDPVWLDRSDMNHARTYFYLIVMPDGKVMAMGGCGDSESVLVPEMYDPAPSVDTWTDMACMDVERSHHATGILLPDARVFVAGGNADASGETAHYDAQIYQPPYLFQGTRPVINIAPAEINYNTVFRVTVGSGKAQDITDVSLIRLGAATHWFDHDQRFMWLNFVTDPADPTHKLKIAAPPHGFVAPPGYYMLFILDDGVPSVAKIVKVASAP